VNAKADYLGWTGIGVDDYDNDPFAVRRVQELFKSGRRGSISRELAAEMWLDVLSPMRTHIDSSTFASNAYHEFVSATIHDMAAVLRNRVTGNLGYAQKIVNLFMKDQWALGRLDERIELELHVPIDKRILDQFNRQWEPWMSWTRVALTEQALCDYFSIQEYVREHWRWGGVFASPIEMEHYWWRGIGPIPKR